MKGRVVRASGLQYLVEVEDEQWLCEVRGRLKEGRRVSQSPVVVGDWVEVQTTGSKTGVIEAVYPRLSKFSRAAIGSHSWEQIIAVNLDQLVVVVSVCRPTLRIGFIDRAIIMALKGKMIPVICLNKIDLDLEGRRFEIARVYQELGYSVCFTSACTGEGMEEFKRLLQGRDSAMVGPSGVGKSSLLNRLEPGLAIRTQELMRHRDQGRHTTTCVHLYRLSGGGHVADTPGIKELSLWGVGRSELVNYFAEMSPLAQECRFRDCTHLREPGCAILKAVAQGRIARIRHEGYRCILKTL